MVTALMLSNLECIPAEVYFTYGMSVKWLHFVINNVKPKDDIQKVSSSIYVADLSTIM